MHYSICWKALPIHLFKPDALLPVVWASSGATPPALLRCSSSLVLPQQLELPSLTWNATLNHLPMFWSLPGMADFPRAEKIFPFVSVLTECVEKNLEHRCPMRTYCMELNGTILWKGRFSCDFTTVEHIRLSEKSQTKTSTVWYHLYVESKKIKPVKNSKMVVTWGWGRGMRWMVFTCTDLQWVVNKLQRPNVQYNDYRQ